MKEQKWVAHPDFADGVTEAIVGAELVERHSIELAFVQVRHWPLTLLLTQRTSGIQCVPEAVTAHMHAHTYAENDVWLEITR